MFTGIISEVGRIEATQSQGDLRVRISCSEQMAHADLGASIACSGVCLTVVDRGENWFAVDVSQETRSRTVPDQWSAGRRLNLERALKVGDELGGHIVTGHVDGLATVEACEQVGGSLNLALSVGADLAPFLAAKGSVALDGVSLTVNDVADRPEGGALAMINIIPHTQALTTFDDLAVGRQYNVEIDILARYLGRMMAARNTTM
jgi:riboflavin synthase